MHEMGIITGVLEATVRSAEEAGADRVTMVALNVGEMTEAIPEALQFAFEALSEGTLCEGAQLVVNIIGPCSICVECGNEFAHDRFHRSCPACGSYETLITAGRELEIDSIEVEFDDED